MNDLYRATYQKMQRWWWQFVDWLQHNNTCNSHITVYTRLIRLCDIVSIQQYRIDLTSQCWWGHGILLFLVTSPKKKLSILRNESDHRQICPCTRLKTIQLITIRRIQYGSTMLQWRIRCYLHLAHFNVWIDICKNNNVNMIFHPNIYECLWCN